MRIKTIPIKKTHSGHTAFLFCLGGTCTGNPWSGAWHRLPRLGTAGSRTGPAWPRTAPLRRREKGLLWYVIHYSFGYAVCLPLDFTIGIYYRGICMMLYFTRTLFLFQWDKRFNRQQNMLRKMTVQIEMISICFILFSENYKKQSI